MNAWSYIVVLAAVASATVAVSLGHIDGQTYAALISAALGGGLVHVANTAASSAAAAATAAAAEPTTTPPVQA